MVIKFILVGKTTTGYLEQGIQDYTKRIGHYTRLAVDVIPELKAAKSMSEQQIKQKEGELILQRIDDSDHVVLLDSTAFQPTSDAMAAWIQGTINRGTRKMVFVVGGAYGFSEQVYGRGNEKLSLSAMTFSHQMVRLIFLEQLYRSFTILNGEPYHHA